MSKLVIVESPAKAGTIEKYLGKDYTVRASVGHVRDLPKSNKNAIDIENDFKPSYEVLSSKKKVITELKREAKKADEVILATDPDREGEAIAWHVAEALKLKDPKRIVFYEITKDAVNEALKNARGIDEHLLHAQEARRVLDRLFGYDLSGLIWKKVRYGLSAGRVQSPALRIIMEKEREIRAFIPEDYWIITADLNTAKKEHLPVTCVDEPRDEKEVDRIVKAAEKGSWSVKAVEERKAKRNPRPPFTTSTLQQAASSRLGFTPSRTMGVAQKLYEAGHITYMRTDSSHLAKSAQQEILKMVESEHGKDYIQARSFTTKSKNTQEAHEAVRPTSVQKHSAGANEEQKKLYDLIWKRAVASQMKPADILQTKILTTVGAGVPDFKINGSRMLFPGWLAADPGARGEDVELPKVAKDDPLTLLEVNSVAKQTLPPQRYSEAGLVKELEKRGIGRPSTYAAIIKTLKDRGYVDAESRSLKPTDTGDVVSSFIEEYFENYISDDFTSEMETELDEIAEGKRGYAKTLKDFYTPFTNDIEKKTKEAKKITDLGEAGDEFPCPKCGKSMVIKLGRTGKFMSCSDFPECHGARSIDGEEVKEPDALGEDPETGMPVYILDGPYGPYVQVGEKNKENKKPKRAGIPKEVDSGDVTLEMALKYLSLPRELGKHPDTGEKIVANIGRFGPFIGLMTKPKPDYRSLKEDDPYTIELDRALEILKEPKRKRGWKAKKKS